MSGCEGDTRIHTEAPSSPGRPFQDVGRRGLTTGWPVAQGVPATSGLFQSLFFLYLLVLPRPSEKGSLVSQPCARPGLRAQQRREHQASLVPGSSWVSAALERGGLFGWCRPVIFVISLSCQTRQTRSHPDIRGSFSPFCLRTRENRLLFHRRVSHSLEQASRCFATACEGLGIKNGSFEQKGIQKEKLFLKFKLQLHPLTG